METKTNNLSFVQWRYQDPTVFHPFWFEKLDYDAWKEYAALNWKFAFFVAALYLAVIFTLKHIMKNRPPLKLQWTLALWNLSLSLFSFMGFFRITQELIYVLQMPNGLHKSICTRIGLNPPAAFYSVAFVLSKFLELGDTIFIVLRKQPLMFLQWYHHCSSLLLSISVMPYSEPIFRWLGACNFLVHTLMYFYFMLKVMNCYVPQQVKIIITTLQLLQFTIGVGINVYSVHVISSNGPDSCARDQHSIKWIGGVYASFMILFAHFFYERYISKKTKRA